MTPAKPKPELITVQRAAWLVGVSDKTIRRRISDQTLTGYRVANTRSLRVDLREVEKLYELL